MKIYAVENAVDSDWMDLYYVWQGKNLMFASVCSDQFDRDIQDAMVEADRYPLELELVLK